MYNKIFSKILDSSIWLEPDQTRIVWITLLAAMDQDGFAQFAGVPNLARRANVSTKAAQKAVDALEGPDDISSDPANDGRRIERVPGGWIVLNAEKYKTLVTRLVQREQAAARVKKHRETRRNKTDVSGPLPPVTCNGSEADTQADVQTEAKSGTATSERRRTALPRRRLDAAYEHEGGLYVPARAHQDLLGLHPQGFESELFAWYPAVCLAWVGRNTGADMIRFWKARHDETWPPERSKPSVSAPREPEYKPWDCQHLEQCGNSTMCAVKNANPQKYPTKAAASV
jgi:hypothetical protein